MKKKVLSLLFFLVILVVFSACGGTEQTDKIKLSFDKNTAYFSSQIKLAPIAGCKPQKTDKYESAKITVMAENAEVIQLRAEIIGEQTQIEGLKIGVDGNEKDFISGVILFEGSLNGEKEKTFEVTIYLSKDTPITMAGKQLTFNFVLNAK